MLRQRGCTVIPLADLIAYRLGRLDQLPPRPVVITADDGHRSVFESMKPAIERHRLPVTLFIYPSAISNASYAMTWPQLQGLQDTGLFTVESHTYWHPNFAVEKRHRAPEDFHRFANDQLRKSRRVLEQRMGRPVTVLAWPFGLTDAGVMAQAAEAGYVASFTLGAKAASKADPVQALPRYLMVDAIDARRLGRLLDDAHAQGVTP